MIDAPRLLVGEHRRRALLRQILQQLLQRRPIQPRTGVSTVVILSLALAIALNTTMYSVLDAMIHPRIDVRRPRSARANR